MGAHSSSISTLAHPLRCTIKPILAPVPALAYFGRPLRRWQRTLCLPTNLQPRSTSKNSIWAGSGRCVQSGDPHTLRAISHQHLPYTTCQTRSQHKTSLPLRIFQLYEFHCLFGADAHHFLFIQRNSNENALANLQQNLHNAFSEGEARIHPRIYTTDDLANLQASCLDILKCFGNTNDVVRYYVITGKIQVEPRASNIAAEDECEWFERAFSCAKYPEWGRLGGKIIDLEMERNEPNED